MSRSKLNRLDKIKKMLIAQTGISIKEFSASLNVSEITIRRDLNLLEEQGFIRLVNGVAIYRMNCIIKVIKISKKDKKVSDFT